MFTRISCVLVFSLAAASAIHAQTVIAPLNADVRAAAGCYALTVSEWSAADRNATYRRIPPRVRLDTTPASRRGDWVLSPNIAYPYPGAATPRWMLSGDTLRLQWSDHFQSTEAALMREDSLWIGEAVAKSDAAPVPAPPAPRARMSLRRGACP